MLTIVAFVLGLGVLIGIHEYGHYRMAVYRGVRVLRFSIGFGKPLLRWTSRSGQTEYVLAAIPLGGYVKMLDEREAPVPDSERHLAFNTQPLLSRALIVAAGPAANLLLAIGLYAGVSWIGVQEPRAILATPLAGSLAQSAGLRGGELVLSLSVNEGDADDVESFEHLRWLLMQAALKQRDVLLTVADPENALVKREVSLAVGSLQPAEADAELMNKIGILRPWTDTAIGEVLPDGAAAAAGVRQGDVVLKVDGADVPDGHDLRQRIRQSVAKSGEGVAQQWLIERQGKKLPVTVTPRPEQLNGVWVGRVGAFIGHPPETVLIRKGPLDGLSAAVAKTWDVSILSLNMMVKMVLGEASLKNLTGPLTIADYAGKSASIGLTAYLSFLALISVSLGVLNLLPLPVLDGGHLMYYLWEGVTGRPISELWQDRFQRGGIVILMAMMSIALFNDVTRLMG